MKQQQVMKLNEDQLQELTRFIRSKGYRDRVIIAEILDHFACKVEEEMSAQPALGLEAAMKRAYASFGRMGFRPLSVSVSNQLKGAYGKIYWKHIRSSFVDPKILPGIILIFLLGFPAHVWLQFQATGLLAYVGPWFLLLFIFLVMIVGNVHSLRRLRRIGYKFYPEWMAWGQEFRFWITIPLGSFLFSVNGMDMLAGNVWDIYSDKQLLLRAAIPAAIFCCWMVAEIVHYRAFVKVLSCFSEDKSKLLATLNE